jgi:hypothetical protein
MFIAIALAVVAAPPPPPNWLTGNELYTYCNADRSDAVFDQKNASCRSYILGVMDGVNGVVSALDRPLLFCLTTAMTAQQMADVTRKWLDDNPAKRSGPAASVVVYAMRGAFPCGR